MKKVNPVYIVILSTFISVIIMVSYNRYLSNSRKCVEGKLLEEATVHYNKEYIKSKASSNGSDIKVIGNGDVEDYNTKGHSKSENLLLEKLGEEYRNQEEKGSNNSNTSLTNENAEEISKVKDTYNKMHSSAIIDSLEDYYGNKESEQSVFKVSTGKIMESLTISDKVRLLYVSMQLGRDKYKKVEAYLYEDNAADGVLKALKFLRQELAEKEYEKVRKIAGRFIDMDVAESLY